MTFLSNVTGLCSFPSQLVGSKYEDNSPSFLIQTYAFSETQITLEDSKGFFPAQSFDCLEKNEDFFMVG